MSWFSQEPQPTDNDELTAAVNYALAVDGRVNAMPIVVTNEDGAITLRGQVHSFAERQMAETLAAEQPGVKKVMNELTIAGEHPPVPA
jgi:osmotically-inducible protein OsmY